MLEAVAGRPAALADVVHRGDELADAPRQGGLDLGEVLGRAAEHLLQQHVRLAQPLEQRRGVVAQHAVRFHHLGHGGGGGLLRALDRAARGGVELADGAGDRRGGLRARLVDLAGDLVAFCVMVLAKVAPFASIDCTALWVMRSISVENFCPCAPNVLRNTPVFSSSTRRRSLPRWLMFAVSSSAFAVNPRATSALTPSSARSTSPAFCFSTVVTPVATVDSARSASVGALLDRAGHLAGRGRDLAARLLGAGAQRFRRRGRELAERTLDLARILLQRGGHAGGDRGERTLGVLRAGADRFHRRRRQVAERALGVLGAGADRLGRGVEQVIERLLDALRARADRLRDRGRKAGQRAVYLGRILLQAGVRAGRGGDQRAFDVGRVLLQRGADIGRSGRESPRHVAGILPQGAAHRRRRGRQRAFDVQRVLLQRGGHRCRRIGQHALDIGRHPASGAGHAARCGRQRALDIRVHPASARCHGLRTPSRQRCARFPRLPAASRRSRCRTPWSAGARCRTASCRMCRGHGPRRGRQHAFDRVGFLPHRRRHACPMQLVSTRSMSSVSWRMAVVMLAATLVSVRSTSAAFCRT